jgi:hypothetical protein
VKTKGLEFLFQLAGWSSSLAGAAQPLPRRCSRKLILPGAIVDQVESIHLAIECHSNNTARLVAPNFHNQGDYEGVSESRGASQLALPGPLRDLAHEFP